MKNKKIYLLIITLIIMLVGLTGCGPNDGQIVSKAGESYVQGNLEDNITSSGALTARGKLVVFAKNNNSVPVDMDIEVEFYDEAGLIVGSDSEELEAVGPNAEIAIDMWSTPKTFSDYKIFIDAEKTTKTCYFDQVSVSHNNTGDEIAIQIKNNSSDEIDYITVSVVYYQGNKVVGYDDSIESDIKAGRSANFNLDYPYDNNYDDVRFDSYKVFLKEAYSYNW